MHSVIVDCDWDKLNILSVKIFSGTEIEFDNFVKQDFTRPMNFAISASVCLHKHLNEAIVFHERAKIGVKHCLVKITLHVLNVVIESIS
jgi:hypothetical protein